MSNDQRKAFEAMKEIFTPQGGPLKGIIDKLYELQEFIRKRVDEGAPKWESAPSVAAEYTIAMGVLFDALSKVHGEERRKQYEEAVQNIVSGMSVIKVNAEDLKKDEKINGQ